MGKTKQWTSRSTRCTIAAIRAVVRVLPPATLEIRPGMGSLAMCPNRYPPAVRRLLAFFTVILSLATAASAEWKEKVLYSFQGGSNDGSVPAGGVVFDKAGNLYGATSDGGMVYQLAPPAKPGGAWAETVLYVFQGNSQGDGATPEGGLVIDSAGNLYGATAYGGTGNCVLLGSSVGCGTVYELSPPKQKGGPWTETVLYSFPTPKQGYFPRGDLVFDGAGNLYGATMFGGGFGTTCNPYYTYCGAVFELSPPKTKGGKWTEKVLHGFKGGSDGAAPNGGLVLGRKGVIYGTTVIGGYNCPHHSGQGCGTVFQLSPTGKNGTWTERQMHVFKNGVDGAQPTAGVIVDAMDSVYGAAEGGADGCGVVFRLAANDGGRWKETVLYSFGGNSYYYSPAVSRFDASGNVYGTTNVGSGGSLQGSVFRLNPPKPKGGAWAFFTIHGFAGAPDGENPTTSLTFDRIGNLYGTTQYGGTGQTCQGGCGTVFQVSP